MPFPKYVHGSQEGLPKTLASRISFLRNIRRIHIAELSYEAKVPLELLEEVEAGIETWLPVTIRQRIARVLKVDPNILEEVEVRNKNVDDLPKEPPSELVERIQEDILLGIKDIKCPLCQCKLKTWIQEGYGLNDELVKTPKAHCTECVFQLR